MEVAFFVIMMIIGVFYGAYHFYGGFGIGFLILVVVGALVALFRFDYESEKDNYIKAIKTRYKTLYGKDISIVADINMT